MVGTMQQMLAYWNAVDMLYSNLHEPSVKLNIAGIVVPMVNIHFLYLT